jgi:hypothetical protein
MESFGEGARRVDIGFAVGQALSVRLREDAYRTLRDALGVDAPDDPAAA